MGYATEALKRATNHSISKKPQRTASDRGAIRAEILQGIEENFILPSLYGLCDFARFCPGDPEFPVLLRQFVEGLEKNRLPAAAGWALDILWHQAPLATPESAAIRDLKIERAWGAAESNPAAAVDELLGMKHRFNQDLDPQGKKITLELFGLLDKISKTNPVDAITILKRLRKDWSPVVSRFAHDLHRETIKEIAVSSDELRRLFFLPLEAAPG